MLPLAGVGFDSVVENVIAGVIATPVVAGIVYAGKPWGWPRLRRRWKRWKIRRNLERLHDAIAAQEEVIALQVAYMGHLRDLMQSFWRARGEGADQVRSRIRRDMLEPIRGFVPTGPGDQVKVVWFKPDAAGSSLLMYEQVGHSEEGQAGLRLPIGSGIAGKAFIDRKPISVPDCEADARFQHVEKGKASGSLACVPIMRGEQCTGVLSVLCTRKNAFYPEDVRYFEAVAAAVAALETFEGSSDPADASG